MTGFSFDPVDLVRLDPPDQLSGSNAARRNGLIDAQYLDVTAASHAMPERLSPVVYP